MVYSTRRFVLSFARRYFVLVFFSHLSIAITSLGGARANLSAFRTFVRFAPIWFCLFPLPLGVWDGLRFVIVALPGLFSYIFCFQRQFFYVYSMFNRLSHLPEQTMHTAREVVPLIVQGVSAVSRGISSCTVYLNLIPTFYY